MVNNITCNKCNGEFNPTKLRSELKPEFQVWENAEKYNWTFVIVWFILCFITIYMGIISVETLKNMSSGVGFIVFFGTPYILAFIYGYIKREEKLKITTKATHDIYCPLCNQIIDEKRL